MKKILTTLSMICIAPSAASFVLSCNVNGMAETEYGAVGSFGPNLWFSENNYNLARVKNSLKKAFGENYTKFEINDANRDIVKTILNDLLQLEATNDSDEYVTALTEYDVLNVQFFWRLKDDIVENEDLISINQDTLISNGTILDLSQDNFAIGLAYHGKWYWGDKTSDSALIDVDDIFYNTLVFHNSALDLGKINPSVNLNLGEFSWRYNLLEIKEQAVKKLTDLLYLDKNFENNETSRFGISGNLVYTDYNAENQNNFDLDLSAVQIFDATTKIEVTAIDQIQDGLTYNVVFYGDNEVTINDTSAIDFTFTTKEVVIDTDTDTDNV